MKRDEKKISVEVTFTEGYDERFTKAILKIYDNRLRKEESRKKKIELCK